MKTIQFLALALWILMAGAPVAAQIRLSYSIVGPPVAAVWMAHDTGAFLDEMHKIAVRFTDRIPKVDPRTVATVLEFEPVKGVDADSLAPKVIDNTIIDKLAREGFIDKAFAKVTR
jgi:hypothetical protein